MILSSPASNCGSFFLHKKDGAVFVLKEVHENYSQVIVYNHLRSYNKLNEIDNYLSKECI